MSQRRWISSRGGRCWSAWLLLSGCTAPVESSRAGEAPLPRALTQRVTATVQRAALRLVRLETERERLLTTPEHPFATPGSGWIRAGRLLPGDEVVSERFGAVRVLSVRGEVAAQPVPVFNLSVASSHAYFVGADRVLVHNTKCKLSEVRQEEIERLLREREEIVREIEAVTQTTPASPRLAELKRRREALRRRLYKARDVERKRQGVTVPSRDARTLQHFAVEHETARKELEAAQKELAELERGGLAPVGEQSAWFERRAKLEREILAFQFNTERTGRIVAWLGELAELDRDTRAPDADRQALEERRKELRESLKRERKRQSDWKSVRNKRAGLDGREERMKYQRELRRRLLRSSVHLTDPERPRDRLELLEEELARRLQDPPSEHRDARIDHVTEQLETTKQLVKVRRKYDIVRRKRANYRKKRDELLAAGRDASEFDEKFQRSEREFQAVRIELTKLRVRERLLTGLDATPWADAPESVDEAHLRAFERQLAEGLEGGQELAGIERELDAMDPAHADWDAMLAEADEVDALLSEREDWMGQGASRERAAGFESSSERLERELREGRAAVDGAVSALVNESAHLQTTQASSSSGASWQERLRGIRAEQERLVAQWRAGLRARVDNARRQLELLRGVQALRDEAAEAELVREIALLERELQRAGG